MLHIFLEMIVISVKINSHMVLITTINEGLSVTIELASVFKVERNLRWPDERFIFDVLLCTTYHSKY